MATITARMSEPSLSASDMIPGVVSSKLPTAGQCHDRSRAPFAPRLSRVKVRVAMCEVQKRLRDAVNRILAQIDSVNRQQMQALQSAEDETLLRLDKQLENLVGEKERAFGALFEHRDEHGC